MPGYQPRPLRLRETAVAALTLHPSCYGLETSRARSAYAKRPLLSRPKQRGRSQGPGRALSAYAKWPLPACNL